MSHFCLRYVAVTNLAYSNDAAITMTDIDAPANNIPKPVIEKKAAQPAITIAEIPTKYFNQLSITYK